MILYLFLVVVGDRQGRSFYSDRSITEILRLSAPQLYHAREQLISEGLISYRRPLIAFGIPGFVLFVGGIITGLIALTEYFRSTGSPFPLSLISITLLIVGLLLMIAGLILNLLVPMVQKQKT